MTKLSDNGLIAASDLYYLLSGNEKIKILDATYGGPQSPEQAFFGRRIDGAQFFDIDVVADQSAALPHTVPSPDYLADCVSAMGISNDDHVVIYDQSGAYMASSRAWWLFRLFGHDNVYVLDGGMIAWVEGGYPTVSGPEDAPKPGKFTPKFRPELLVSREDILQYLQNPEFTVVDARPAARFHGQMPEPRPGMRAGHIPGSLNLPFGAVMKGQLDPFMKEDAALEVLFNDSGISREMKTAISCGSGVTACTVALALFKARGVDSAIYDGSWSEWGDEAAGTPVEISA